MSAIPPVGERKPPDLSEIPPSRNSTTCAHATHRTHGFRCPAAAAIASGTATAIPAQNSREYASVENWYRTRTAFGSLPHFVASDPVAIKASPVTAQAATSSPPSAIEAPQAPRIASER